MDLAPETTEEFKRQEMEYLRILQVHNFIQVAYTLLIGSYGSSVQNDSEAVDCLKPICYIWWAKPVIFRVEFPLE